MRKLFLATVISAFTLTACNSTKPTATLDSQKEVAITIGQAGAMYNSIERLCKPTEQDIVNVNEILYRQETLYPRHSPFHEYYNHGKQTVESAGIELIEKGFIKTGSGSLLKGCEILINEVNDLAAKKS